MEHTEWSEEEELRGDEVEVSIDWKTEGGSNHPTGIVYEENVIEMKSGMVHYRPVIVNDYLMFSNNGSKNMMALA
jgi:hypothetical protein